jgi:aryl-phospho-beta-D-glucosidase BglC (GH1 family)
MLAQRLKGLNFGGWFSQVDCIEEKDPQAFPGFYGHIESFIGAQDFQRVKSWGFNHVRLPIDYFNFFRGANLEQDERSFRALDVAIEAAEQAGLLVMLDLHKCPGHDFHSGASEEQPFFTDPVCRADSRRIWSVLAERYGNRPSVMLEILNEPTATDSKIWDKVKDEMFWHIRKAAPKSTIVVGSNKWNSASEFAHLTPLEDDNVLYSFHFYNPVVFTHQMAPWVHGHAYDRHLSYPGNYELSEALHARLPNDSGVWDRARMERELGPVLEFRAKYKVPVACGEFGVYVGGPDRVSQVNWMTDFLGILAQAGIGYSYWNYKNLDFGVISTGESLHQNLPQYNQNAERLDTELLGLLARG